jgi:hypothetical protein
LKTENPTERVCRGHFEQEEKKMSTDGTTDRRRLGVIETRYRTVGKLAMYDLTINGRLWACVEWSPSRRGWCIQDGSGRCLAHCDAVHGQDIDAQTAVKLAKAMIRDGRIPCPEDAHEQLAERLRRDRLGEPMQPIQQPLGEPMEILTPQDEPFAVVSTPRSKSRKRP